MSSLFGSTDFGNLLRQVLVFEVAAEPSKVDQIPVDV